MPKSLKSEKLAELIKHSIDLYLTENLDFFGFSHVVDVNMGEDLKTAHVYIAYYLEKDVKILLNRITADNRIIVKIFKKKFTSKFIPKLKYVFIKENGQL